MACLFLKIRTKFKARIDIIKSFQKKLLRVSPCHQVGTIRRLCKITFLLIGFGQGKRTGLQNLRNRVKQTDKNR